MKRIVFITIFWITYLSLLCAQGNGTYYQFDLEVGDLARQYTLYVPEGYDGVEELPVVFCLHGMSCSILQIQEMTKLYLVADTAKFFIVYPQGLPVYLTWIDWTDTGWNVPDYSEADQNDVAFISQIIDDLNDNSDFSIDLNRIHVTGQSAGGAMAHYLAFELSNRIASVASVSGQISDTLINHICDPIRPISVLHMQGTKDWALPDTGDYYCLPLDGVTDYWAGINGCNAIPDSIEIEDIEISDSSTVTLFEYGQCNDDLEVLLYRINGGGHTWPGGYEDPSWGWGQDIINMDINASVEIWNFFKRNPHPNPWVEIPDTAFLYALIDEGVDANDDSLISYKEAEAITYLVVSEKNISDLTGIEAFINLDTLDCSWNELTSLDVSNNTALEELSCGHNQLTSLDVSNNAALGLLGCNFNELTSLDVSNNTALWVLDCSNNRLTSLDVSGCTALMYLYCNGNQLTSLDVSSNTALTFMDLASMSTLHEICVWEMPFPPVDLQVDTTDSPNVDFTTDCAVTILNAYKEISTINIYPNPSDDIINIEIENINNATIEIYTVSGRLIFSKALDSKFEKIDISGLSEGMYFVKVRQKNNVSIEKLIVY